MPNPGYGAGGYGQGGYGNQPIETLPIGYYLALLTSQYQPPSSPKLNALLYVLLKKFDDVSQCLVKFDTAFDLDSAVGVQLDALGQIAGVSRVVGFNPTGSGTVLNIALTNGGGGYLVAGDVVVTITGGGGSGATAHVSALSPGGRGALLSVVVDDPGSGYTTTPVVTLSAPPPGMYAAQAYAVATIGSSPVLDDETYRLLIKAKIAQNQWDGTIDSLYFIWKSLFPTGGIVIADNQNMTATIYLSGGFSSIVQDLIVNGYIVPRPEGVLYTYVFAELPVFGFGEHNTSYVAAWGVGKWAA